MVVINKIRVVTKGKGINMSRVRPDEEEVEPRRLRPITDIENDIIRTREAVNELRDNYVANPIPDIEYRPIDFSEFNTMRIPNNTVPLRISRMNRLVNNLRRFVEERSVHPDNRDSINSRDSTATNMTFEDTEGRGIASSVNRPVINTPPVRTRPMIMNEINSHITLLNWIRLNNPTNINGITSMVTNIRNLINEYNEHQDRLATDIQLNMNDVLYPPDIPTPNNIQQPNDNSGSSNSSNGMIGRDSFDSTGNYKYGLGFSFKKRHIRIR
jgi:hypothetical protein